MQAALIIHFGSGSVQRGDKAFDLHANTYRVDADVVATFEYRYYFRSSNSIKYNRGTQFYSDNGPPIINYPQQAYENGVSKNAATRKRFKAVVRILKNLASEMADGHNASAKSAPSFLIESLVWNVPDDNFDNGEYN